MLLLTGNYILITLSSGKQLGEVSDHLFVEYSEENVLKKLKRLKFYGAKNFMINHILHDF